MADRKQAVFENSIHTKFMKTEGKTQTDKMIHLLAADNKRKAEIINVDKKIDSLQDSVDEIKKMLEGVIK